MGVFSSSFHLSLSLGVVSQGWQADPTTRMVMPKKPGRWQYCAFNLYPPSAHRCVAQTVFSSWVIRHPPSSSRFYYTYIKNVESWDFGAILTSMKDEWHCPFCYNLLKFAYLSHVHISKTSLIHSIFLLLVCSLILSKFVSHHHMSSSPESHWLIHLGRETYWFMQTVKE